MNHTYKHFAVPVALVAIIIPMSGGVTRLGPALFDEAISRAVTVVNRADPVFDEAISRAATVVNRTDPVFDEAISRPSTVVNRTNPVFDEAISRAATACNAAGLGDHDGDGSVDLDDFAELDACLTGPDGEPPDATCEVFDFDCDHDVDLRDFGGFQVNFAAP